VSNVVKLKPRQSKPTAKHQRRRIGRDFFAALIIGVALGAGLVWMKVDYSRAAALVGDLSTKVHSVARDFASKPAEEDEFPVSSIGRKPVDDGAKSKQIAYRGSYPVCSVNVRTRDNCVIDGDTFYLGGTTIRISDIDAPETHPPRCAREADLGDRATRRLSKLLSSGPFKLVRDGRDIDRYGRQLRVAIRDGRSIGKMLVSEGLARPWTGKRRPWCGGNNSFG
jgi:micrococcal nuclease